TLLVVSRPLFCLLACACVHTFLGQFCYVHPCYDRSFSLSLSLSPSVTVSQSGRIQCHPSCHTILPTRLLSCHTHTFAARRAFEVASPLPEIHVLCSRFPQ
ncbi:unnamed protein product, partial [Ectocarpus sp. 13 AM-2016]